MRLELLDPRSDERWRELIERAPEATAFHHPAWLSLIADHYRYPIEAPCLVEQGGRLTAGLPWARVESRLTGRRLVALPFTDACEPLIAGASERELAGAVEDARLRAELPLEIRAPLEGMPGSSPQRYWRHVLTLDDDADVVARRARQGIRRGVAKARREGLSCARRTDPAALDTFYRLHLRTRRHQGVPTQSKRFIVGLARLFASGNGFVAVVTDGEGAAVAAAVFLHHRDHLIYKYGASQRAALARRPNNLLFAEVIRWACEAGYRKLDFGRTDLEQEGLRGFKRGWGADEIPLHYTYVGADPSAGRSLPQRLLAPAIRRSPPFVGRLVGAALYRHFG
jgi:CelD/BcsL family acetyltransferase involved in cellulose biosynthesis